MEQNRQQLATEFYRLKERKADLEFALEQVKESITAVESRLVLVMENENLQNFKDGELGTFYLRTDVRASIADEIQAFQWLRDNGMDDIIKPTVHSKTLSAIAKDHPEIPGVNVYYQTRVSIRK